MLQKHHVFPQILAGHPVLEVLAGRFAHDAIENLMSLPSSQVVASDLSSSPHTGGHLATYHAGFNQYLNKVGESDRFHAAQAGDLRALDEMATDVHGLVAAAKYALANGHLFANTPTGMTPEQANSRNDEWFEEWRQYAADNTAQIQRMHETIDQLHSAGQSDAALRWPLLSPTEILGLADRIELLKRIEKSSPISLHFSAVGSVPESPGLVPPSVDTRLRGFIPPSLEGANKPEGFESGGSLLNYGLRGLPALPSDWQRQMQVPPSVAMPTNPQVLQFHSETGQPLIYLSDASQVLGPEAPPDQGSASLMGAAVLGSGLMMIPGAQSLGAALLAGLAISALTRPAFPASISSDANVADGKVFSGGATSKKPLDANAPIQGVDDRGEDSRRPPGLLQAENGIYGSATERARTFAERFGNWPDTPAGSMTTLNAPAAPPTSAVGAAAPEEVRRLTRVNASNAGSVFTAGSAPIPFVPSEFTDRFGDWAMPTGDGGPQQTSKPVAVLSGEPSYVVPPPIFAPNDPSNSRHDAEEWFSRWIRPFIRP